MLPALESLLGKDAKGLSANSICRLKERWYAEYEQWRKRDLSRRRYVYVWADGVYCHVRMDDKLCLLVIMGVDDTGRKEVLGVLDGHRESEASWTELIEQLRAQGLQLHRSSPSEMARLASGKLSLNAGLKRVNSGAGYIRPRMCLTKCPKAYSHE